MRYGLAILGYHTHACILLHLQNIHFSSYFQLVIESAESTTATYQLEKVVIVVNSFIAYIYTINKFNDLDIFQFSKDVTGHGILVILLFLGCFTNYIKWSFLLLNCYWGCHLDVIKNLSSKKQYQRFVKLYTDTHTYTQTHTHKHKHTHKHTVCRHDTTIAYTRTCISLFSSWRSGVMIRKHHCYGMRGLWWIIWLLYCLHSVIQWNLLFNVRNVCDTKIQQFLDGSK